MDADDPTIKHARSWLHLTDPITARKFEKVLLGLEEEKQYAAVALMDLGEAATRMVLDLDHDGEVVDHLKAAIEGTPEEYWSASTRLSVALE